MEDSNKLIADFMGMQDTDLGWYDSEEAMSEYACQMVGGGNTFEVLQYDRSWDWLMPVVQKCYNSEADTRGVKVRKLRAFSPGSSDAFDNLVDAVSTLDMHNTYDAVVEFIKQHNKKS